MKLIRDHGINVVLDVGANRGFWSQHLRMSGYTGHLLSFEPISGNAVEIDAKRKGDTKWQSFTCALGAEEGTADFNVVLSAGENVLSSFLPMRGQAVDTSVEKVSVKRLESYAGLISELVPEPRIFLKMDTQGFDAQVTAGAGAVMEQVRMLQSEISVEPLYDGMLHYTESLKTYEGLGFKLMDLFVVNRIPTGAVLEYDCLMSK